MNLIERRTFLKTSALAAASAAATARAQSPTASTSAPDGIKWDKAPCRFCGTGCHVKVGVKDGKVVAIDRFGKSAPGDLVMIQLGMTSDTVVAAASSLDG